MQDISSWFLEMSLSMSKWRAKVKKQKKTKHISCNFIKTSYTSVCKLGQHGRWKILPNIDEQAKLLPNKDNKRVQAVLCAYVGKGGGGGFDTTSIIGLESSGRPWLNTEHTCWEESLGAQLSTGRSYFQHTIIAALLVYFVLWKDEGQQH